MIGVVDASGVLVGVLPVVRLAEAVIARVTPEALLADISDMVDVTRFGQAIGARVVRDVMVEPAAVAPHGDPRPGVPPDARASPVRRLRRRLRRGVPPATSTCWSWCCCTSMHWRLRHRSHRPEPWTWTWSWRRSSSSSPTGSSRPIASTRRSPPCWAARTVVILGVIRQEDAFAAIDLNVIFLLAGMMILAAILRRTGFFQWLAIRSVKVAGGEPLRLLIVLSVVCALVSALLDNVTTVVLIAPVTLYIATALRVSPLPFLISEILASNIGGTATLIGDPPNILIGSAAGLGFIAFLLNLAPDHAADLRRLPGHDPVHASARTSASTPEVRDAVLALDEREVLTDLPLLRLSLAVIGATLVAFLLAQPARARGRHDRAARRRGPHAALAARGRRGARGDRVADAVLLRRPVHARRGDRPGRHHRCPGAEPASS